ncbi:MAG TPA: class I SAM-dependent methyltransferase [Opitutaceae bacterium]|nr:class I SAM-dependent methyltransferase [Opitutaceae bacterium]
MANDNKSAHAAAEYDAEVRRVIPYYDAIHAEALDVVRAVAGEPECWVETGAGTGALAASALTRFSRTRFVLADPSEAMLGQARLRLADALASGRVTILPPVTSERLPEVEPRLRAQAVTAVMCHHYLEPEARRAAVRGCFEILEPGGVLVVFENVESESSRGRELGLRRWREFQLRQGREAEAVDRHLARFGTELKPVRIADHLALLRETGFGTAELIWRAHMQAGFVAVK